MGLALPKAGLLVNGVVVRRKFAEPTLVCRARGQIRESLVGDVRTETLVRVNVIGSDAHRFESAEGQNTTIDVGLHVGTVTVRTGPGFVFVPAGGFHAFESDGLEALLVPGEFNKRGPRFQTTQTSSFAFGSPNLGDWCVTTATRGNSAEIGI